MCTSFNEGRTFHFIVENVTNANDNVQRFRAGISAAGERLTDFGDPIIETFFRDLKPAHTYCYFAYQG